MGWEYSDGRFDLGPLLQGQTMITKLKSAYNSFGVIRFDLGPLLQGQTRIAQIKSAITRLLLVVEVWDGKPTYGKSWVENLLVWLDLTLGASFKVKRG